MRLFEIESVLDVGCGEGYSTEFFADLGCRVVGIEGYAPSIERGRRPDLVRRHDYAEGPLVLAERFDLAWCCEFVEHVEERYLENVFVTLASARLVLMTYAVPGQGGHHHVNEQPREYWVAAFHAHGFRLDADITAAARLVAQADWQMFSPDYPSHFMSKGFAFVNTR